jgi:hypothetical protein
MPPRSHVYQAFGVTFNGTCRESGMGQIEAFALKRIVESEALAGASERRAEKQDRR